MNDVVRAGGMGAIVMTPAAIIEQEQEKLQKYIRWVEAGVDDQGKKFTLADFQAKSFTSKTVADAAAQYINERKRLMDKITQ